MDWIRSVAFALRVLAKTPGFTAVAVIVLSLGIGANTAIFSIVNAVLFQPLRIERPEQIFGCFSKDTQKPDSYRPFSYPNFADLRERNSVFSSLTAHNLALVGLTKDGLTRRVIAETIASNFFSTFGVPLFRGRAFTLEEELPDASQRVVIVGYSFWQREGADPDYVGKTVDVNGKRYTVVGIAPEGFTAATALISTELWFPLGVYGEIANDFMGSAGRSLSERDNHSLVLIGRLNDGTTLERADSELEVLAGQLAEARGIFMAFGSVALLLSVVGVYGLRAYSVAQRTREMGIRMALGASRGQALWLVLKEGLRLSAVGTVVGLVLAVALARALSSLLYEVEAIDPIIFLVAPTVLVVASVLACLVPARRAARVDPLHALKYE